MVTFINHNGMVITRDGKACRSVHHDGATVIEVFKSIKAAKFNLKMHRLNSKLKSKGYPMPSNWADMKLRLWDSMSTAPIQLIHSEA